MDVSEFKCKWINKSDLWSIVDDFRQKYWPENSLPVDIEKIAEFRLNLLPEPKHDLFSSTEMDAYLKTDLTAIVVDYDFYMNDKYANRMRFSFAHEVGHFFLHQNVLSALDLIDPVAWKNFILDLPEDEYSNFEWQANEFAGRLLVPHSDLVTAVEEAVNIIKENHLADYLENDPDAVLSRVAPTICKPFSISTDIIKMRVSREGLWPPKLR
ncbi:MAG: ImmA/IrrE family metallo-endopeptidase [Smithellaceae bacterium]